MNTFSSTVLLIGVAFIAFVAGGATVEAHPASYSVTGDVRDRASNAPLTAAIVVLASDQGMTIGSTATDASGRFALRVTPVHRLRLRITTVGYRVAEIALDDHTAPSLIHVLLERGGATQIGRSRSRTNAAAADSDGRLSSATLADEGALRVTDALKAQSGVTVVGDASAPGGDAYVSVRGLRPGETRTLLDGHPIGPIGVAPDTPDTDGSIAGFNFQDAPYFALRGIDVTSGGTDPAAMRSDSIGGAIDLLTISPTTADVVTIDGGVGNENRGVSSLRATGTIGKLGYVVVDGLSGTTGVFPGAPITQAGLRGTDFTSATRSALTYDVSGDYLLRNGLLKVGYSPIPSTSVLVTSYAATSWADKTGEGDNDFLPAAYVLASAPIGVSARCPHGVAVTTDAGSACLSPSTYAQAASGPAGGGPDAWQALRNQDDDLRISRVMGSSVIVADAFDDAYAFDYHRAPSLVSGPSDEFLDRWSTQGVQIADQTTMRANTLGFNVGWLHEEHSGNGTALAGPGFVQLAPVGRLDQSAAVDDWFAPNQSFALAVGTSLSHTSGDPRFHLDPRFSARENISARDVLRFTARRSTDEPSLGLARLNLTAAGALNPDCGAIARASSGAPAAVNVGSGPATSLAAETGSDLELGYTRRLGADGSFDVTLYDANVRNRLVTGDFAAGSALTRSEVAPLLSRIDNFCGIVPPADALDFTLSRTFNAATARLHGIELASRVHLMTHVALHYAWDVQSIVLNDLPAAVLKTDATLVNGLQVFAVPLQKATLGADVTLRPGWEFHLDGHAVGPNNPQQLPGYAYADASLDGHVARHVKLLISASNVFNSHVQTYGLVGLGLPYATNPYNAALGTPFLEPFNERYGLAPIALNVRLTATL